jgi:hypothetical protein
MSSHEIEQQPCEKVIVITMLIMMKYGLIVVQCILSFPLFTIACCAKMTSMHLCFMGLNDLLCLFSHYYAWLS